MLRVRQLECRGGGLPRLLRGHTGGVVGGSGVVGGGIGGGGGGDEVARVLDAALGGWESDKT